MIRAPATHVNSAGRPGPPRWFCVRPLLRPALGETVHLLAPTQRVEERWHIRIDVLGQRALVDSWLRKHPLLGHFLPTQDLGRGEHGRPPLVGRIGGGDSGETVLLPLGQEIVLVLSGYRRSPHPIAPEGLGGGKGEGGTADNRRGPERFPDQVG